MICESQLHKDDVDIFTLKSIEYLLMINERTIAVVVPAYNEEKQIKMVIDSMPDFVDRIVVVNDGSTDRTADVVRECIAKDNKPKMKITRFSSQPLTRVYDKAIVCLQQKLEKEMEFYVPSQVDNNDPEHDRIILINNLVNGGVGAAIARGYKWCLDHNIFCTAVMAGDGQMDPSELLSIVLPVVNEEVDYVKGNRLIHRSAWIVIPLIRYFGNSILSILTKIASGYWRISDTQCGYTAISLKALEAIDIYKIYRNYGMPNDLLVKLNISSCTIREVPIKPVYGVGEKSKMNILKVIPALSFLLFLSFLKRLWQKYLLRDFHPVFFFYHFAFILGILTVPYALKIIDSFIYAYKISYEPLLAFIFLSTTFFQSLFFSMWMDIIDNERLYK